MGRLNYTNRKSEGPKLGEICAKDLTKRIPPKTGSKAALRDPIVELDVSNKTLTDDGLAYIAEALIHTYHGNSEGLVLRLEEFNLRANGLTAQSLVSLVQAIRLASLDLRDLDLSNNSICIQSQDDIAHWEHFLQAFSGCCVLRRIDLSGNNLGSKAFEILAKVYSQESPIDFILPAHLKHPYPKSVPGDALPSLDAIEAPTRHLIISSGGRSQDAAETAIVEKTRVSPKASRFLVDDNHEHEQLPDEDDCLAINRTTRGLRSVPYIVLSDTSIDEISALHLSYVVANHHLPDRLLTRVPAAKAGVHAQQLVAYDIESHCRGVIYLPNGTLTAVSSKVLDLAERARRTIGLSPNEGHGQSAVRLNNLDNEASQARRGSGYRRSSTNSAFETQESIATDLDRARSRIQGHVIEDVGHQSNDLWRIALRMLAMSRQIRPQIASGPPPLPPAPKPKLQIIRTLEIPGLTAKKPNRWGNPLAPKSANQTISLWQKPRKGSLSTFNSSSTRTPESSKLPIALEQPSPPPPRSEYRSNLPRGFPEKVWCRILGYVVDAQGILSQGQQGSVYKYALDRENLRKERDALGLKEGAQKWHVLEDMDCLAYEMK